MRPHAIRGLLTRHYVEDNQVHAAIAGGVLLAASFVVIAVAPFVRDKDGAKTLADRLPDGVAALLGIEPGMSIDSAAGYLDAWMISLAAPLVLCALALPAAVRAVAGAEDSGEMEWLAAQPISRTQIVWERFLAITIVTAQAALPATLLLAIGGGIGELQLEAPMVVWSMIRVVALVSLLAGIVVVVSAVTGSLELAGGVAVAAPLVAFGLIVAGETTARVSPVRWALGSTPVAEAGAVVGVGVVIVFTIACVVIASAAFQRRDVIL